MPPRTTKAGVTAQKGSARPAGRRVQNLGSGFLAADTAPHPELFNPTQAMIQGILGGAGRPGGAGNLGQNIGFTTGLGFGGVPMQQELLQALGGQLSAVPQAVGGFGPLGGLMSMQPVTEQLAAIRAMTEQAAGMGADAAREFGGLGQGISSAVAGEQARARSQAQIQGQLAMQQALQGARDQSMQAYLAQIQGAMAPASQLAQFGLGLGGLDLQGQQLQAQLLNNLLGGQMAAAGFTSAPAFLEQGPSFWEQAALGLIGAGGNIAGGFAGRG